MLFQSKMRLDMQMCEDVRAWCFRARTQSQNFSTSRQYACQIHEELPRGLPEQFSDASDVAKTPRSLLADTEPLRESPSESDMSSSE